jgi:hypothetical protein
MPNSECEPHGRPELLDAETRSKLPELYSGEERGLEALAQVKFFTLDVCMPQKVLL